MKRICAWCEAHLGGEGERETHGICEPCKDRMLAEINADGECRTAQPQAEKCFAAPPAENLENAA